MYPPADRRVRLPLIVAGIVALVLLVRWIVAATEPPNRELINLLGLLVRVQLTSTLLANALTFAAVIFAAVLIPLTVVWSLRREEQPRPTNIPEKSHASIQTPASPRALDGTEHIADLPAGDKAQLPARTPQPEKTQNSETK